MAVQAGKYLAVDGRSSGITGENDHIQRRQPGRSEAEAFPHQAPQSVPADRQPYTLLRQRKTETRLHTISRAIENREVTICGALTGAEDVVKVGSVEQSPLTREALRRIAWRETGCRGDRVALVLNPAGLQPSGF